MPKHEPEVLRANDIAVCVDDEAWFAAHPDRNFRFRLPRGTEKDMCRAREKVLGTVIQRLGNNQWAHLTIPVPLGTPDFRPDAIDANGDVIGATDPRCRELWELSYDPRGVPQ